MTDHGGAASPRTAEDAALDAFYRHHILSVYHSPKGQARALANVGSKESWRPSVRAALAAVRAAQEAPAPEGRCVHCGGVRDAGVHDTVETCDTVRGPCLDPGRHHPYRAEAPAPEGLRCRDLAYDAHDWDNTGSPSFCRDCGLSFPRFHRLSAGGDR